MMGNLIVGFLIFCTVLAGYLLRSLTISGAGAAFFTGLAVFYGFGVKGLLLLGIFFLTSSLWSKFRSSSKHLLEDRLAKGSQRDWRQVAANGGIAAILGVIYPFYSHPAVLVGFAVALASSNSDTWASEIGPISKKRPVSLRTLKRVDKGTSGAVSLLGTVAALAGAFLIAAAGSYLFNLPLWEAVLIFFCGFLGNLIDTLLGAYLQKLYLCESCGIQTEKPHHCGRDTKRIRGISFLDNDLVNFLSGLPAVILACAFIFLYQ